MTETPHNPYEGMTDEQIGIYEFYMANHPEVEIPIEDREDHRERAGVLDDLLVQFERDFDLQKLFAITDLTPEEASSHPIREPAKKALAQIVSDLKFLKKESDIPADVYEALEQRYQSLSRAVGVISGNTVDHAR